MKKITTIFLTLFLAILYLVPGSVFAENDQHTIAVFPFSLRADTSAPNTQKDIQNKIARMLKQKLEETTQIQAVSISSDASVPGAEKATSQLRKKAVAAGANYMVSGNIFMVGKHISIDAILQNLVKKSKPVSIFAQADSSKSMDSAITSLGRSIISEILKKQIISLITIEGNQRVESDAIESIITSKVGDIANADKLSQDLQLIYKMGFFDDVVVRQRTLDKGLEILFHVKEKPSVREITFQKNRVYDSKELRDIISTSTGSILNIYKLNSDIEKIRHMYMDKNYHNCQITHEIKTLKNNQADIIFTISEGKKLHIETITFDGNQYFSKKKILKAMKTKEKGFWSFLTSSGELDEVELSNDTIRIQSLYKNNGFIDVRVSDPKIDYEKEAIKVSFKIEEGDQYKTGEVDVAGDILTTRKELLDAIKVKSGQLYNREKIRTDILALTDIYSDKGYANVEVSPRIRKDQSEKLVDITFDITQGDLVYFNRITIAGNHKTRDKVIRRELAIKEQEKYSKSGIQRSFRNLTYKDYFKTVDITPVKTADPNYRDVRVTVEEKPTGNFAFGGGYSSEDGGYLQLQVEEKNLFGRGQIGKAMLKVSNENTLYSIGFTEPWLFDKPISAGIDIYRLEKEYDYYERDSMGMSLQAGFRQFFDYTTMGIKYNIEKFDIHNVNSKHTRVTEGDFLSSSITPYIKYDSRNHFFLPTKGFFHKLSLEYAGEFIGGEIDYTKYLVESGCWLPLFWKFTLALHGEFGYLDDRTNGKIDIDWERFYLGGINTVRGFDNTDINGTRETETIKRGGEKYVLFNAELIVPIQKEMGVAGVLFYDRGDVYRDSESIDLMDQYSSAGVEIRWNSPMGPIRIAYGIVIDGKGKYESGDGQFDFSVGAFF